MEEGTAQTDADAAGASIRRELLVFGFGGSMFGIDAPRVDVVAAFRTPTPLPRADARIDGVVQDRGRIVSVLRHPTGRAVDASTSATRLLICTTEHGHLGLPADSTHATGAVTLHAEPVSGAVVDSSEGALTYLDPAALARALVEPVQGQPEPMEGEL